MGKMGKYIYGVINSNKEEFFDVGAIVISEDVPTIENHVEVTQESESRNVVYTIPFQDISAVVSDSEIIEYSRVPKNTLAWLLVSHQQVIEKVMAKHTIIPVRLGTFANDDKEVAQILSKGYRTIKDIFERAKNCVEIDVVATLGDFDSFLQDVSEQQEIRQLKDSLLTKKDGITTDDQIQIGVLLKKCLDKRKGELANQIQTTLAETAGGFKAHDLMDEKMVLNMAFLLDQNRLEDFGRRVEYLNNKFEEKLDFRCVGPLPPYSFYTLEVKKMRFEEVDWARRKLGIEDDFITASEIKKAHRRLALTCHPDKNPDILGINRKFEDMTRAYKILLDYYRASSQAEESEGFYLNDQAFEKNSILVTTTR